MPRPASHPLRRLAEKIGEHKHCVEAHRLVGMDASHDQSVTRAVAIDSTCSGSPSRELPISRIRQVARAASVASVV
jgi:hypothetical protein